MPVEALLRGRARNVYGSPALVTPAAVAFLIFRN
jgi:hypothetical protein